MRLQNFAIDYLAEHGKGPKIIPSQAQLKLQLHTDDNVVKSSDDTSQLNREELKATGEVLKTTSSLAKSEKLPKLHFDEVGRKLASGLSGRTASKLENVGWLPQLPVAHMSSGRSSGKHRSGGTLSKAVNKWLLAERKLPKLVADQKREKQLQLEKMEKKKFIQLINNLPHTEAKLSDHKQIHAFWDFFANLDKGEVTGSDTLLEDNLERFLRFCKLHASFEQQRQVFYSMCARQTIKERQLELLKLERDTYRERSEFVEKLLNTDKQRDQANLNQCFEGLVDTFAEKSFKLCSLKSRLEFLEKARQVKNNSKKLQEEATSRLSLLKWQLLFERKLLALLELEITRLFK